MRKPVWLEFENDDKLNAFMRFIQGGWLDHHSTSGFSRIKGSFTKHQIKIAIKDFGAKVVENDID